MDLSTTYLGLELSNPIVPSASPLSASLDSVLELEDAGASALVMHSLFEEQITQESHRLDHYLDYGTESFAEALSYFPQAEDYNIGPNEYLEHIQRVKGAVDIPVIGSVNGISIGGWIGYARLIEEAGADALELNIYYISTSPERTAVQVEDRYVEIVKEIRRSINIPLAVKIGPFFSSMGNFASKLRDAGADALVLFNRFYQPDFDLHKLEVVPRVVLSRSNELLLPLRWVAILYGRVDVDFAITSGVHTYEDVLKGVMAGANVTMMASELLQNGPFRISEILEAMRVWMEEHEYESVEQMRGSMSQENVVEPSAFERANYMKVLQSWRPDPISEI